MQVGPGCGFDTGLGGISCPLLRFVLSTYHSCCQCKVLPLVYEGHERKGMGRAAGLLYPLAGAVIREGVR